MQKIERRIRMILAFKELAIQWKRQAHQNATVVSATPRVEDRQDICGAPLFPVQAGCCSPQQADSPFSLGCLGMCPGQQFQVFQGYTVKHAAPPTLVSWSPKQSCMKFNCCEVTLLWASQVRRLPKSERCLASPQLFQIRQHRCQICENHSAEPSQPTEICEILTPPSSLKTSAEVFRLEPEGLQSGMWEDNTRGSINIYISN